jgi:hypothetical protein
VRILLLGHVGFSHKLVMGTAGLPIAVKVSDLLLDYLSTCCSTQVPGLSD